MTVGMLGHPSVGDPAAPLAPEEKDPPPHAVHDQLERLLASPLFQRSKRCTPFLRFIVLESLKGRAAELKERRIGMDVFQRDPAYDTSADPIVRTTAIEVRKRLAQYYQDVAREQEIRIELVAGHYAPQIRLPNAASLGGGIESEPAVLQVPLTLATEPVQSSKPHPRRFRLVWISVIVVAVAVLGSIFAMSSRPDPIDVFWRPLWNSADPITVVIGDALDGVFSDAPPMAENARETRVGFVDSIVQAEVAGILEAHRKRYDIRLAGSTTLADLRRAPAVLVGALNNVWTMRFQDQLHFAIRTDGNQMCIEDRQKPDAARWVSDLRTPYLKRNVDYGVIARFLDPKSQQQVLMLAGMGGGATRAAGEFVTQFRHLKALAERAPSDWGRKNLEVVIAVDLVNGNIAPPRIVATYFW
jgi:hypothetical protein